jgi:hypothetical protein
MNKNNKYWGRSLESTININPTKDEKQRIYKMLLLQFIQIKNGL